MRPEAIALGLALWLVLGLLGCVVWHLMHVWLRGDR